MVTESAQAPIDPASQSKSLGEPGRTDEDTGIARSLVSASEDDPAARQRLGAPAAEAASSLTPPSSGGPVAPSTSSTREVVSDDPPTETRQPVAGPGLAIGTRASIIAESVAQTSPSGGSTASSDNEATTTVGAQSQQGNVPSNERSESRSPATTAAPATTRAPATTAAPATTRAPATTAAPATTRAPATTVAPTVSGGSVIHVRAGASGDGSQSSPLGSIKAAIDRVQPGGTVLVHGGTYGGFEITRSGNSGAWITVAAAPGERVLIDPDRFAGISMENVSFVEVRGFEVRGHGNSSGAGIRVAERSQSIRVIDNHVYDFPGNGIEGVEVSGVEIRGNIVHGGASDTPEGVPVTMNRESL